MKRLLDCISPWSWFWLVLATLPPLILLLEPTAFELGVLLVVDFLALLAFKPLEARVFEMIFPDTRLYLRGIVPARIAVLSTDERARLIESFMAYPKRRAVYCYVASFPKVLPAYAVAIFYWQHAVSNLEQFALLVGINLVTFWYFYGAVFIESHLFLSAEVARLHDEFDFTAAFKTCRIKDSRRDFFVQEITSILCIVIFLLILEGVILGANQKALATADYLKLASIGVLGLALFLRVWQLSRRFMIESMDEVFRRMALAREPGGKPVFALSTSSHFARFGRVLNDTMERLRVTERELSQLVVREAERGRYRAIGELSALIAHDLSGPIHVARFCAQELGEKLRHDPVGERYARMILTNTDRAADLIISLRARLKNAEYSQGSSFFGEAHHHAVLLLRTQFPTAEFNRIRIHCDEALLEEALKISRVDLIHVLDNLYRNAVRNLIDNQVENPEIILRREGEEILLIDNGSGLSAERFEELTSYYFESSAPIIGAGGLGLRLTRRLVELNGGDLSVRDPEVYARDTGTVFVLRIPDDHEGKRMETPGAPGLARASHSEESEEAAW